jgi:hypothetical protein
MLSSVVNSRHYRRRPIHPLQLHCRGVEPVTASPLKSAFTNCHPRNLFRISSYENCRVLPPPPQRFFKSYLSCASFGRSYCSLLSLFAPRVFHNSFVHNSFRTLSKKCRGVPLPILEPARAFFISPPSLFWSQSPMTSHLCRLTPSPSADSINLHPADRYFRRQSQPRGGIP